MPGVDSKPTLHIQGWVLVGNPGITAELIKPDFSSEPGALNVSLHIGQKPGMFPAVMTWARLSFRQPLGDKQNVTSIQIKLGDDVVYLVDSVRHVH